jgi:hypothetical protein
MIEKGILNLFEEIVNTYYDPDKENDFVRLFGFCLGNLAVEDDNRIVDHILEKESLIKILIISTKHITHIIANESLIGIVQIIIASDATQLTKIIDLGGLNCLVHILYYQKNPEMLEIAMEGLNYILKKGEDFYLYSSSINPFILSFSNLNGIEALEIVIRHPNKNINQMALQIHEKYFGSYQNKEDNFMSDSI